MEEDDIRQALRDMESNRMMNTTASYSANIGLYPDNKMPFTDKHMAYLKARPSLKPEHYLANLRLIIKKRG